VYFIPSSDLWVLAVANSPVNWWYSWRKAVHGKDEALRFIGAYASRLPIPKPTNQQRDCALPSVESLVRISAAQQETRRTLLDWLRVDNAIEKPSNKLLAVADLDSDAWVGEVKRIRGKKLPLTAAGVHASREEFTRTIEPARARAAETMTLERSFSLRKSDACSTLLTTPH
jgi:hypothetical protein